MKKILTCCAIVAGLGMSTSASAMLEFFGEDRGVFNQDGSATGAGFANSASAESQFLSNLIGVGTEDFESFADGSVAPLGLIFPGAGTATLTGGGSVDDDPGTGQNAISGSNWWRTGPDNDFVITFSDPISAFGFYGIDVGDIGAQLTLSLANGGTIDIDIPHTLEPGGPSSGQNGSVIFYGIIDANESWTSATLTNINTFGDDFGFDDMTIGSVDQIVDVPAPATVALFGLALAGLGWSRRKG